MELANIEGKEIVIRVKISALKTAFEAHPNGLAEDYRLTSLKTVADSLVRRLNDEEEDGTTPVHRLFDAAFEEALEQGDEGFAERAKSEART